MSEPQIIIESKGIANGVQGSYAEALKGMPQRPDRPAPSIGYQCPAYADVPGMQPAPASAGDATIDVGGPSRLHV
jgi:hypothetical protein